ncbi:peptidoglycan-binding domain-containing protein [Nostoc sp. 'Peltigera membranacea cyanobiont' 232]|uniref:peptidoglycan-binding domain-containing protein n=1 Tax=Nostoc sp. 'Peltigera membranacea cyanobiont' 232 TaxID=2014531 RepID=UPI001CB8D3F8|nr:peptidoglycan-binding domain-containing protein [Nostoc sp. 'Peltigera membranacea cyanobiont' 232]
MATPAAGIAYLVVHCLDFQAIADKKQYLITWRIFPMATELKTFIGSQFINKPVLADIEFIPHLEKINDFAANNGLKIYVTSSARPWDVPVVGPAFPAAKMSNHFIGHAIDMNIKIGGKLYTSHELGDFNSLPSTIQAFFTAIRNHPVLHWGGDFGDPVHIDDRLNKNDPNTWKQKLSIIQSELTGLTQPGIRAVNSPRLLFLTTPLMEGNDVKAVQEKLIGKGFNLGITSADGLFGPATSQAVAKFQEQAGLDPIDGMVGDKTRQALGL